LSAKAKEATKKLLEGIEREVLTKGGLRLRSVAIGDPIYEVNANARLKRSRRILRTVRQGPTVVEEYIEEEEDMVGK
ncbi:hypothetical protein FRC20_005996, partial [Serendipita sp. 405]